MTKKEREQSMKVNEFLNVLEIESLTEQGITTIIPLAGKYIDLTDLVLGDEEINQKEKVVFNSEGLPIEDEGTYSPFGLDVCFQSDNEEDEGYEIVDVRTSKDGYDYVYNEDGEVWIVIA